MTTPERTPAEIVREIADCALEGETGGMIRLVLREHRALTACADAYDREQARAGQTCERRYGWALSAGGAGSPQLLEVKGVRVVRALLDRHTPLSPADAQLIVDALNAYTPREAAP